MSYSRCSYGMYKQNWVRLGHVGSAPLVLAQTFPFPVSRILFCVSIRSQVARFVLGPN
jgi:hypothetical protein